MENRHSHKLCDLKFLFSQLFHYIIPRTIFLCPRPRPRPHHRIQEGWKSSYTSFVVNSELS